MNSDSAFRMEIIAATIAVLHTMAEKAARLAEQANQPELAARNRKLLELYRAGKPARETP